MADPIKRTETAHIAESQRAAISTPQWFVENRNSKASPTHPITHNNALTFFICGEEAFRDIAQQIEKAEHSIDLCCWGFDPGMELVRSAGTWPRGPTFGDLLINAAKRGVDVRLLIWYDMVVAGTAQNMPGYSHDLSIWGCPYYPDEQISARNSLELRLKAQQAAFHWLDADAISSDARNEYCVSWFRAIMRHQAFKNITVAKRSGDSASIATSLASESRQPGWLKDFEVEGQGMLHAGTHHQKTILIDYRDNYGKKAVGYVMGLNSVTDYWCTTSHRLEDTSRERGGELAATESVQKTSDTGKALKNDDVGFRTKKPYQDYACRIQGGALISVYQNFVSGWDQANKNKTDIKGECTGGAMLPCAGRPPFLTTPAEPHHSTVQIVRTQPQDGGDKSIKELYFQATDIASLGAGYLYLENQYFQYQDWSERLISKRKAAIAAWNLGTKKAGKKAEDMPILYVFVVIPVAEREQMVPRTYDALAVLGQEKGMVGQQNLIDAPIEGHAYTMDARGRRIDLGLAEAPQVVKYAKTIMKPELIQMEDMFGLKVCTAMLQTSGVDKGRWRYREIYIHSKLMLVNDCFLTLGSANLNQRSMSVDSELNMATNDARHATALRKRIFDLHSDGKVNLGGGSPNELKVAFKAWTELMAKNKLSKSKNVALKGFLLPIEDNRSSTVRLG